MIPTTDDPKPSSAQPVADVNATCDNCGAFGAVRFADTKLCVRCYAEKGSCCCESGEPPSETGVIA